MVTPSRSGGSAVHATVVIPNGTPQSPRSGNQLGRGWAMARYVIAPVLVVAVVSLAGAVACQARPPASATSMSGTPIAASGATIRVHVTGAVQSPGVYELRVGDRVAEALLAAGGVSSEADNSVINLAQRVHDEQRLEVPARAPSTAPTSISTPIKSMPLAPTRPDPAAGGASVSGGPTTSGADLEFDALLTPPANPEGGARINVNQATVAQLERLPGIGAVSAKRVATWRADNGPIRTVADLRAAGLTTAVLRKALPYLALR